MPKGSKVNGGGQFAHLPFGGVTPEKMRAEAERQKQMKKFKIKGGK